MKTNLKKAFAAVIMTTSLLVGSFATTAYAAPKQEICDVCSSTHIHLDNAADGHWCGYYRETRYSDWEVIGWQMINAALSQKVRARKVAVCCQTCGNEFSSYYQYQYKDYVFFTLIPISDWHD